MGNFDKAEERMTAMQSDALARKANAEAKSAEVALAKAELERRQLELLERQVALQEQQAAALSTQVQRTAPRENPDYKPSGVFTNPANGEPWALTLKCEMLHNNILLNKSSLTREEVEQLNRLQPIEHGLITKTDRSTTQAKVVPTFDAQGRLSRLQIQHRMGRDDSPQAFPPIDDLARQLADQAAQVAA